MLGELLKRLRRVAVDGAVPEGEFVGGVRALGLDGDEQARLRAELARMGLPVRDLRMHVEIDSRNSEKVVRASEGNVTERGRLARALLSRYEDDRGQVSSRALEGVVRLAGLDVREAAELRTGAAVRPAANTGGTGSSELAADPGAVEEATAAPADGKDVGVPAGELADAVAAALAVLKTDRYERRASNRLLSAEAEVGLAVLVRGGVERIAQEPGEEELTGLPRDDVRVRARDCLVIHNLRLVHSLVRPHLEQGLDYDDLVQHGALGLMRAARKFDPTMGNKFSTYATWWIRQAITRAIADEGALIRIPVHMHEQMRKVARAERTLVAEGRPASDADVAVRCDITLQKVQEIRRLTRRTDSLDRVIGDGATLADFVGQAHFLPSVEKQVVGDLFVADVLAVVDTFTEREARILVRRLGLDGDDPSTLDELGSEFGVTRERIRQIEGKARPVLQARMRGAGLIGLDAACEEAERAAEKAAEAVRVARYVRATHAARTARARLALRRARAERLARTAEGKAQAAPASEPTAVEEAREENSGAPIAEAVVLTEQVSQVRETTRPGTPDVVVADWERACRLAKEPSGQSWLAEYALAAVGHEGLVAYLGRPAADAVVRVARHREPADRPVLMALEVLRRIFDHVADAGLRPEDFFDRPTESPRGVTPRAYLANRPLVNGESRLAVRDALREFLATLPPSLPGAEEPERVQETERLVETQGAEDVEAAQESDGPAPVGSNVHEEPSLDTDTDTDTEAGAGLGPHTHTDSVDPEAAVAEPSISSGAPQFTADWDRALKLTRPPLGGGVVWLAEYALLALGHVQVAALLGSPAAGAVVRAARHRGTLDRPVVEALEVLREVVDAVRDRGLRPERFFECAADALTGATPREYLVTRPLVSAESRRAVRDALGEFVATRPVRTDPAPRHGEGDVSTSGDQTADAGGARPATSAVQTAPAEQSQVGLDAMLVETHTRHEAGTALLAQEYERRLSEERNRSDERVAAVRAEGERQLDALEEELLHRADRARERHEKHVRRQADERLARLKEQHQEAYEALLHRAERAEEAARQVAGTEERAQELEQRLREYRESTEARIGDLEAQLRDAQTAAAERERAAGAWAAELETRLRQAEAAATERERAVASAREEYRQGAQLRIAEAEARLREAEAALTQRDLFVEAARRRAEEAEQEATQRIAQSEHNAWLRITDLQTQLGTMQAELAAAQEAAQSRTSLRDRWRRG
ncbi:sigma-70 family RNA polymerase sigma factor [Streptomyces sp. NPDC048185]|uniref:sigma-70 family RNA polymerase sigma factor n=1 Tax=Streptomyces sp. NPDC048185 TaxID=3365508 RepID=UPI00371933BB